MIILKEHLKGEYGWKPENLWPAYKGEATRRLFNRWDGVQVLFIINVFVQQNFTATIQDGLKAEELLLEKLPLGHKSELSVLQWLQKQN